MGLLSKEGLKSKALLPLHKMVNYAKIGVVVMQLLRTPVDPSQPWHCWCLQRRTFAKVTVRWKEVEKYIC